MTPHPSAFGCHLLPQGEKGYAFMTTMAGDRPGYEDAVRALFAGDAAGFEAAVKGWPEGVREHVRMLAGRMWRNGTGANYQTQL